MSNVDNNTVENNNKKKAENWIDYTKLPLVKAKVKFYNSNVNAKYGFVTILDSNNNPVMDAFVSGGILEKAGIYSVEAGEILEIKHVPAQKGESVIFVARRKHDYEEAVKKLKDEYNMKG